MFIRALPLLRGSRCASFAQSPAARFGGARLFSTAAPRVAAPPQDQTAAYLTKHQIVVESKEPVQLLNTFQHPSIHPALQQYLSKRFAAPTPIQALTIPLASTGSNIVGIARTGSGKTLSYAIPVVAKLLKSPSADPKALRALILAPTRELVQQIQGEVQNVLNAVGEQRHVQAVYGGVAITTDLHKLKAAPIIIIATPGRLIDLLQRNALNLQSCEMLVVDEADRMLEMGFTEQLDSIKGYLPSKRQTTFWSATWPKEIQKLALTYTSGGRNTCKVFIGGQDLRLHPRVKYHFHTVEPQRKGEALAALYEQRMATGLARFIAFTNLKRSTEDLVVMLRNRQVECGYFHGGMSQAQRDRALKGFRHCRSGILVATDVAARGIDIEGIDVVNVDMPTSAETFIHRTGRTARGDQTGDAYSFINNKDGVLPEIARLFEQSGTPVPAALQAVITSQQEWR